MATAPIFAGVTVYPSDIERGKTKIGKTQINANGGRTFIQRTTSGGAAIFKNTWKVSWKSVTNARRLAVMSLANVTTTTTWVDENGDAFTVHTEEEAYNASVAFIAGNGDVYYDVTLMIWEV